MDQKGRAQLASGAELRMAVPQAVRRAEEEREARRVAKLRELEQGGVDLSQVSSPRQPASYSRRFDPRRLSRRMVARRARSKSLGCRPGAGRGLAAPSL